MLPNTIAFIPDGNRRYALKKNLSLLEAYMAGTSKAWQVINWLSKYREIRSGVFYTLSLKNLERKKREVDILFKVFDSELEKAKENNFFEEKNIRIKFIGRKHFFPKKLVEKMDCLEKQTQDNNTTIELALGYDGQQEIVDAVKTLLSKRKTNLSKKSFENALYTRAKPDLIIRTSGEKRLSGFLCYQAAYSELYFSKKLWPEFNKRELKKALNDYEERQRRFGK